MVHVSLRLPRSVVDVIDDLAYDESVSRAQWVRRLVQLAVFDHQSRKEAAE
jgi:hypothetical protein